jgi:hypothetical protein
MHIVVTNLHIVRPRRGLFPAYTTRTEKPRKGYLISLVSTRGTCGAQCLPEVAVAPSRHALRLAEQLHGAHINGLHHHLRFLIKLQ